MARRLAGVRSCASVTLLIIATSLTRPDVATAQGATAKAFVPKYEVTGFRDARFGMTEPQVRKMAKKAFGIDDGDMTPATDAVAGTTKLIVHVRMLEPGLGEGRVEYVFGYRQHKLFQVNVVWGLDTNPPLDNMGMIAGAMRLQSYFLGFAWAERSVRIGVPVGVPIDDRAVLLFSGADEKNSSVSVVIEDILYELAPNGIVKLLPESSSGTKLIVSYESSKRDVREISRNEF